MHLSAIQESPEIEQFSDKSQKSCEKEAIDVFDSEELQLIEEVILHAADQYLSPKLENIMKENELLE